MVNYWLLADIVTFLLLIGLAYFWFRSLLTLLDAYVNQICYYMVSPHMDTNVRCENQATFLSERFFRPRDQMIYRTMFSTVALLVIIAVRYVMEVVHAAV